VGRIARTLIEAEATREQIKKLRQVAEKAKAGELSTEEAIAQAAAINPAFKSVPAPTGNPVAFWSLIVAILSLVLNLCMFASAESGSKQAHEDAQKQLQASQSVERAQRRIYGELHRQRGGAKSQARETAPSKASPMKKPKGVERKRRARQRQELNLLRRNSRRKP
jgi:hypothetical protein